MLRDTILREEHIKLGAKMVDFASWNMPLSYSEGIIKEHLHCRASASIFDTCHMGEFHFKGSLEKSGIEYNVTIPLYKQKIGTCKYGFILNEHGGVIDDIIIYKIADDELFIVVNAGTIETDFTRIGEGLNRDIIFENISETTAKIDLQGPLSMDIMIEKFGDKFKTLKFFNFTYINIFGKNILVSRTGYTGEIGYEFYLEPENAIELWNMLLSDNRVKPAGLGARNTLRLEMGMSLYGHDLDEYTSPLDAKLGNFIDFDKDFRGKKALLQEARNGLKKEKIAFITHSRRAPRDNDKIFFNNEEIGIVTSGTFSPSLNCGIGIGFVPSDYSDNSRILQCGNISKPLEIEITNLPFYKKATAKKNK